MNSALLLLLSVAPLSGSGIELLSKAPQAVFGGGPRGVEVVLRNRAGTNVNLSVSHQLVQTSSATAAPWSPAVPWRPLSVLSNQTIIEQMELAFPPVAAPTRFLVRLFNGREFLGPLDVWVYPTNILSETVAELGQVSFDSTRNELREALESSAAGLGRELSLSEPNRRRITIHGPLFPAGTKSESVANALDEARSGSGVILIQMDDESRVAEPTFHVRAAGKGRLVRVQDRALANIANDPRAQLRLARILRLAAGLDRLDSADCELKL